MSNRNSKRKNPLLLATLGAAAGLALAAPAANADVCFADTGLDIANDYQSVVLTFGNGGTLTPTQHATGGNPDSYLQVDHDVNSAPSGSTRSGLHSIFLFNGAVYDPSVSGAISRICYEEWARMIQGAGDVQGTGPIIRQVDGQQNVTYYRPAPSLMVNTPTNWNLRAMTCKESDFVALDPTNGVTGVDPSRQPDFSKNGQPIEFGFFRGNNTSVGGGGYFRSAAIDSWSITVISECVGDLNQDGVVDFGDLLVLLALWGNC